MKYPEGVKLFIFSFLPIEPLILLISKLSIKDRSLLTTSGILDQPRLLTLTLDDTLAHIEYCLSLCTGLRIHLVNTLHLSSLFHLLGHKISNSVIHLNLG